MFTNLFTFERDYIAEVVWMGMDIHTGMDRFSIIYLFRCLQICLQGNFLFIFYLFLE